MPKLTMTALSLTLLKARKLSGESTICLFYISERQYGLQFSTNLGRWTMLWVEGKFNLWLDECTWTVLWRWVKPSKYGALTNTLELELALPLSVCILRIFYWSIRIIGLDHGTKDKSGFGWNGLLTMMSKDPIVGKMRNCGSKKLPTTGNMLKIDVCNFRILPVSYSAIPHFTI